MHNSIDLARAGILRRIFAMVYDTLLLLAILMVASLPWVMLRGEQVAGELNFQPLGILFQVYVLAIIVAYFAWFWGRRGQTIGMRSWRLKLVDNSLAQPSMSQILRRIASAPLAWLPMAAGVLWMYVDRDELTWHDRLSGTRLIVVAKKPKTG